MNTKLHAVTDANGRPISLFMTAGQFSDYTGALLCWTACPRRNGCWTTGAMTQPWFRDALQAKGVTPCIPGRKTRDAPILYDKRRYKRQNPIEPKVGAARSYSGA